MERRERSSLRGGGRIVYDDDGTIRHEPSGGVDYEAPLDEASPWTVSVHLEVHGGRLVATDLRIRPRAGRVPEGGITSRVLRTVRVAELVDEARQWADDVVLAAPERFGAEKGGGDAVDRALEAQWEAFRAAAGAGPAPPGRRRRDDVEYLPWAVEYVRKLEAGSRAPVAEIARERAVPRGVARDRVHVARSRGLLTEVPEGARIGGRLTDKARALLSALEKE